MNVWILAEQNDAHIAPVSYELLQRARDLQAAGGIGVLVVGPTLPESELQKLIARGADLVLAWEGEWLRYFQAEGYSRCLEAMVEEFAPQVLLGAATSIGRTWLPYAAMRLHTGLTADCTSLVWDAASETLLQTRPAIGGNIMATIKTPNHRPQMATIRPHSTAEARPMAGRVGEVIRREAPPIWGSRKLQLTAFAGNTEKVELAAAERVVVVGRGIKRPENLELARALADALGAALGATREVVDRGWLPYSCQIGLSGRTITPKLYVGLGVSGAIQHLAGMQTAERIVAVNTDADAQIFTLADYGIVGNVMEVVPALLTELRKGGCR